MSGDGETFTHRATADGQVLVSWEGRVVTRLRGRAAARLLARMTGGDEERVQAELRRATGNFKHGNERRPRDR